MSYATKTGRYYEGKRRESILDVFVQLRQPHVRVFDRKVERWWTDCILASPSETLHLEPTRNKTMSFILGISWSAWGPAFSPWPDHIRLRFSFQKSMQTLIIICSNTLFTQSKRHAASPVQVSQCWWHLYVQFPDLPLSSKWYKMYLWLTSNISANSRAVSRRSDSAQAQKHSLSMRECWQFLGWSWRSELVRGILNQT